MLTLKMTMIIKNTVSAVQYTLWAEMLVGETHDSFDSPPEVPMFGMKRARGRCSTTCNGDLNAALAGVADKIVSALSPQPSSSSTSPTSKMLSFVASTCNSFENLLI